MECISLTETQCLWTANNNVRQLDLLSIIRESHKSNNMAHSESITMKYPAVDS